jgi:competence protein ComEC
MRIPAPLSCAIALATCIALRGAPTAPKPPATPDDRTEDTLVGTVGGPVITTPHGYGAPLETGDATVWMWSDTLVEPGDRVRVIGRLRSPRGLENPGGEDRRAQLASRGAQWELTAARIDRLGRDDSAMAWAWRWSARVQRRWTKSIEPERDAAHAALAGIVTGDRTRVPPELDQRWRNVGIYHVLSVSGLHLAVVAGLLFALLRRIVAALPIGARTRPARWAAPIALVLAVIYTLVTGGQLATVRALVVVAIIMIGEMVDRPVRLVDALGVAAILILLWRPQDLFDPSFQLSFVAALTLALRPRIQGTWWHRWVASGFMTSACVALTTAPITALQFHQVAAGGIVGNLVLTPIIELVALPLGFVPPLVPIAAWVIGRVDDLAGVLAHAVPVGNVALASPLVMIALAALSLALVAKRRLWLWIAIAVLWGFGRAPPTPGELRVTFLDVGQGDAAIVELPTGKVLLVDAGGNASARNPETASAPGRAITRTLDVYGHAAIDLAIISHPHPDHYLGLPAIDVPIRELWFAGHLDPRVIPRGTRIGSPQLGRVDLGGGVTLDVLGPRYQPTELGPTILAPDPVRTVNDNSLVVVVRFAGRSILFAGDLEEEGERALVAAGLGHVDVVKVAHHGSPTSSSPALIAATSPRAAVISCGVGNAFGFPTADVVERWRRAGARVLRTDQGGSITVAVGPTGTLALP